MLGCEAKACVAQRSIKKLLASASHISQWRAKRSLLNLKPETYNWITEQLNNPGFLEPETKN